MNSISWPALHVWIFIAQLVEYCSATAEATSSYNRFRSLENLLFFGLFRNCLNCDSVRWSHIHFCCTSAVNIISFRVSFLSRIDELNKWPACQCMGHNSSDGRALQRERRDQRARIPLKPRKTFFRATTAMVTSSFDMPVFDKKKKKRKTIVCRVPVIRRHVLAF